MNLIPGKIGLFCDDRNHPLVSPWFRERGKVDPFFDDRSRNRGKVDLFFDHGRSGERGKIDPFSGETR